MDLPRDTVPTLFSESQRTTLVNYKGYLVKVRRVSEDDVVMFQGALASVLFREEDVGISTLGKLACPVQSYMALLALRSVVPCRFWVRSDRPNLAYDGNPRNRSRPSVRSIRTS